MQMPPGRGDGGPPRPLPSLQQLTMSAIARGVRENPDNVGPVAASLPENYNQLVTGTDMEDFNRVWAFHEKIVTLVNKSFSSHTHTVSNMTQAFALHVNNVDVLIKRFTEKFDGFSKYLVSSGPFLDSTNFMYLRKTYADWIQQLENMKVFYGDTNLLKKTIL